jgi:diguanylate cyclase (GGDEF)-like protein
MTLELPVSTPEMVHALRHDRVALMREAILWQRPIRLVALGAIVALALAFGREDRLATLPAFGAVMVTYALVVELTARAVRHEREADDPRVAFILVSADILALGALVWLSSAASETARLLVPALLVVQMAAYYFGRGLGTYAAALATSAYLVIALAVPPHVPGAGLAPRQAFFTAGLFALVSALLVSAYATFRARMHELRVFCKMVEEGDLAPALAVGVDKRPDDLTLLARSFDAMRLRLAEQIGTDPLTGCLNRRALETRLRAEWRQAKRRGTTVAVLGIDLDHFKQVNDTRGHPYGDTVLRELAGIFRATARDTDAVARLGGDEFVIVLPDTGWQGALTFAERVRRKVADFSFGAETEAMRLTISVGVAMARGTDPISPEMLLQEADRSLYKAKAGGRNRVFA